MVAVAPFRALHESGCFVMPNPWDVGSAALLHHAGFPALATTSAGVAFARGLPDRVGSISRDTMLDNVRAIAAATPLPVNADFQEGYASAHDFASLDHNVKLCVDAGAAGLSIEDATGDPVAPLFERELAVERLRVARAAVDKSGVPVVLTARCEAFLVGAHDAKRIVLDRLVAFADAGADCLYAPGIRDLDTIAEIVRAVAPKPVNAIVASAIPGFTVAHLADVGVRRISLGSALARVAWGAFLRAVRSLHDDGAFDALADAATFTELDDVFGARSR